MWKARINLSKTKEIISQENSMHTLTQFHENLILRGFKLHQTHDQGSQVFTYEMKIQDLFGVPAGHWFGVEVKQSVPQVAQVEFGLFDSKEWKKNFTGCFASTLAISATLTLNDRLETFDGLAEILEFGRKMAKVVGSF